MASQSEVLRFIELFQHLGFSDTNIIRMQQFLEGKGTVSDLDDLKNIVDQR